MLHTMMQACKETNMTYQALKFYCNQGLCLLYTSDAADEL